MFCEAVCRYRFQAKEMHPLSIGDIYAVAEDVTEQTAGFLLTGEGRFLKFPYIREGKEYRGFIGYKEGVQACVFKLIKTKDSARTALLIENQRFRIRRLYGVYPTLELAVKNGRLLGISKVPELSLNDVFRELKLTGPNISCINQIYYDNSRMNDETIPTIYRVIARDGEISVDVNLLVCSLPRTVERIVPVAVSEAVEISREEVSNSEDFLYLIHSFLKDIQIFHHSFISHSIIKHKRPLFFTFFVVQNQQNTDITVIATDKLYSFVSMYDSICDNKIAIGRFLKIPSFMNRDLTLIYQKVSLLQRYRLKPYKLVRLLRKADRGENIFVEDAKAFFWMITYAMDAIDPIPWPGLVISPMNEEMAYLLSGPYSFMVGHDNLFTKYKYQLRNEQYKIHSATECKATEFIYNDNDKLREPIDPPLSYMINGASRKGRYLQDISNLKLKIPHTFPLAVPEHLSNLERAFFERPYCHEVRLIYDLDHEKVIFPRAYIYDEDPLILWLIVFPGELDYDALLDEIWDMNVYGYMIRRACLDQDSASLSKILSVVERDKIACKNEIVRHIANYPIEMRQKLPKMPKNTECVLLNICQCRKHPNVPEVPVPAALNDEIHISYENQVCGNEECSKTTMLFSNGILYRLTTIHTLLGCYESGYFTDEVILNIHVYLRIYNLPVNEIGEASTSKFRFNVD